MKFLNIILAVLVFAACGKKGNTENTTTTTNTTTTNTTTTTQQPSKRDMLLGTWIATSIGGQEIDPSVMGDIVFNSDGTMTSGDDTADTWELSEDGKVLTMGVGGPAEDISTNDVSVFEKDKMVFVDRTDKIEFVLVRK